MYEAFFVQWLSKAPFRKIYQSSNGCAPLRRSEQRFPRYRSIITRHWSSPICNISLREYRVWCLGQCGSCTVFWKRSASRRDMRHILLDNQQKDHLCFYENSHEQESKIDEKYIVKYFMTPHRAWGVPASAERYRPKGIAVSKRNMRTVRRDDNFRSRRLLSPVPKPCMILLIILVHSPRVRCILI